MDPLSVTASVIALLGAGGKIISLLSQLTAIKDAPELARITLTEMHDISAALRHIQDFVKDTDKVPAERRQHIRLEHLVAALTGCLTTYSELNAIVESLNIGSSGISVSDRAKWIRKEARINTIVQRLQNHKSSLNLMLSVLQSTSIVEIKQTVARLDSLLEQVFSGDDDLYERLSRLRETRTLQSGTSNAESILSGSTADDENATVRSVTSVNSIPLENVDEFTEVSFTFDSELARSRVYLRVRVLHSATHSETSMTSSAGQTMALSFFTTTSLAEISNLSMYCLPICAQEVGNASWYTTPQAQTLPEPRAGFIQRVMRKLRRSTPKKDGPSRGRSPTPRPLTPPLARRPPASIGRPPTATSRASRPSTAINRPRAVTVRPRTSHRPPSSARRPQSSRQGRPSSHQGRTSNSQAGSRLLRSTLPRPPTIYEETSWDSPIRTKISTLATLIDQHVEIFYRAESVAYTRQEVGKTIIENIISGNNDGITPFILPNWRLSKLNISGYCLNGFI